MIFIGFAKGSTLRAFVLFAALMLAVPMAKANTLLCRVDKSVRSLRVDKADDGTCKAVYTKEGVDQVVGTSAREQACQKVIESIRRTLEASVWKCKEVKAAPISYISGE